MVPQFIKNERRKCSRVEVHFSVMFCNYNSVWTCKREMIKALTLDLCEDGVALMTEKPISVGRKLIVKFQMIESGVAFNDKSITLITLHGHVVYSKDCEMGRFRAGISFDNVAEEKEEKFYDLVCSPY